MTDTSGNLNSVGLVGLALVVLVLLEQLLLEVGFVFLFLPKRDH